MSAVAALSIVCWSFWRILVSLMMLVSRSLSLRAAKCSFCASSVRLMYCAFSLAASFFARVVLPTQGVPVTRMTRLLMRGYWVNGNSYCLRMRLWCGLASWCVAFGP